MTRNVWVLCCSNYMFLEGQNVECTQTFFWVFKKEKIQIFFDQMPKYSSITLEVTQHYFCLFVSLFVVVVVVLPNSYKFLPQIGWFFSLKIGMHKGLLSNSQQHINTKQNTTPPPTFCVNDCSIASRSVYIHELNTFCDSQF